MINKKHWTDSLNEEVYNRLCNCSTIKSDILPLAQSKWNFLKNKEGFAKEDALVQVLELLDCNSCYYDLTHDEYNEVLRRIV